MPRALALATALLLVTTAFAGAIAIAQSQGDQDQGQDGDRGDQADDRRPEQAMSPEERRAWAQEQRQQAMDRAERAGLFGPLSYEDGQVDGTFVASTLDEDASTVTDHRLLRNGSDQVVLAEASVDAESTGEVHARGSTVHLGLEDASLRLFDNPTAQLQVTAQAPVNVTFTLADGYEATVNGSRAKLAGPVNATILLAGEGSLDADGDTVTASLEEAGVVQFKVQPSDPGEQARERALEHAAQADRLGGEIRVAGSSGEAVDQNTSIDVEMRAQYASAGQAIVETDADLEEGRVLQLSFAKDNLNVSEPQEVATKVDRDSVATVDDIDDVVNATAEDPLAHVAVEASTVHVTLWMPDFSLHSVNVQDATQDLAELPEPIDAPNPSGLDISMAEQARQRALSHAQAWDQLPPQAQTQAIAQAETAGLFGQATVELGTLQATHVRADVQADAGALQDYTVQARDTPSVLFDEVRPADFTPSEAPVEMGPAVALPADEVTLTVHDTPTAHLEAEAGSSAVVVELSTPADAEIDRVSDRILEVTTAQGLTADVVLAAGNGELIVEGDTIVANLGANAAVHALAQPGDDVPARANLDERVHALAEGALGAEASVTAVDAGPVEDRIENGVDVDTSDLGEASVTVTASSQNPDARAVALNLDPSLVDDAAPDETTVLVDGAEIDAAASAQAVFEAGNQQATYHVQSAGGSLQVLVNLDGFSDHDVTVQSDDGTDDGTDDSADDGSTDGGDTDGTDGTDGTTEDTPAVGALLAVAIVAAAAALRRR